MKLRNPPAGTSGGKANPPIWYGGPNFFYARQWSTGKQKHGGNAGKVKPYVQVMRAIAERASAYAKQKVAMAKSQGAKDK